MCPLPGLEITHDLSSVHPLEEMPKAASSPQIEVAGPKENSQPPLPSAMVRIIAIVLITHTFILTSNVSWR